MAYDEQFEARQRRHDEERRHEQQLDRDIRHAPAPEPWPEGVPLPEPPAGWRRSAHGGIERIP
jgi:hypothetical protein